MLWVGKSFKFDAAHFLPDHPKCGKVHGHTYHIDVEVRCEYNPETGMCIDLGDLTKIVNKIISKFDHSVLNDHLPITTCENIAKHITHNVYRKVKLLVKPTSTGLGVRVKVQEGDGGYAIHEI